MKKLLDLILIILVLGVPVFLFVVLPERESGGGGSAVRPPLPLPEPAVAEGSLSPTASAISESGSTGLDGTEQPAVGEIGRPQTPATVTDGWTLEGYLYRGGSNPMAGEVPVSADLSDSAVLKTDRSGRFQWVLPQGELYLLAGEPTDPEVSISIPPGPGTGLLSVHRYFQGKPGELITPECAFVLQCPQMSANRVLTRGSTRLPDGAQVTVRLIAAEKALESTLLRVRDGKFGGELPISDREFHAGSYTLQFAWSLSTSTQRVREAMRGTEWGSSDREVARNLGVFFGTPEEAAEQIAAMQDYYTAALDELEGTRDLVLVTGSKARGKRNRLLRDPERAARLRSHVLAEAQSKLFRGSRLDREEWRKLIDERIPEVVKKYLSYEELPHRYRVPGAAYNLAAVAQQVIRHSRLESQIIYEHLSWPGSSNDYVSDLAFGIHAEKTQSLTRLRNYVDAVREYLDD